MGPNSFGVVFLAEHGTYVLPQNMVDWENYTPSFGLDIEEYRKEWAIAAAKEERERRYGKGKGDWNGNRPAYNYMKGHDYAHNYSKGYDSFNKFGLGKGEKQALTDEEKRKIVEEAEKKVKESVKAGSKNENMYEKGNG